MTTVDAGTAIGPGEVAVLVGLRPPSKRPKRWFGRADADTPFEVIPLAAYEQPVWVRKGPLGRAWLVSDPAGIKQVLIDKVANYPKMELERRLYRALFGDGLISSVGETWRAHRRIMAPSFDPHSVADYTEVMTSATEALAEDWDRHGNGGEIDVSDEMTRLTLEIICRTMFSADYAEMTDLTGLALERSTAFNHNLLDLLPIIKRMRMRQRERDMARLFAPMDGAVKRLIEARRRDPSRLDLLGRLVAALDEETGLRLTPQEVRDEVLTTFVAGHETSAAAMTFVWYLLAHHPDWEAKLHAELDQVLGGRTPTNADLPRLALTRRIIEESMRLYPPVPGVATRTAEQPDEICGHSVPAGGMVGISSWVLHRHRMLWDDPVRFDPDRFLPERSVGRPRFAYLPFGAGPRVCIGQLMAMTELTLILATLAQRYRLRLRSGHRVKIRTRVTIRPVGGLPMTVTPR